MVADAYINCRVTADTKARIRAIAAHEGRTESAVLKDLVMTMLREPRGSAPASLQPSAPIPRDSRLYVRVSPRDRRLIAERAAARGVPAATYAAMFLGAHLRNAAPLPKTEYLALREAVAELGALGRTLQTIARALEQDRKALGPGKAEVQAMMKVAAALRDHFKGLLEENARAWKDADA